VLDEPMTTHVVIPTSSGSRRGALLEGHRRSGATDRRDDADRGGGVTALEQQVADRPELPVPLLRTGV